MCHYHTQITCKTDAKKGMGREAERNCEKKILLENVPWLKLHLSGARRQGEQTDLRGTEESGIGAVLILPSTPQLPLKDHE